MGGRLCNAAFWIYVLLAALALALIPLSALGVLEPTPLAGIYAVLLAQPWLSLFFNDISGDRPLWAGAAIVCSICVNAAILRLVCRFIARPR